MAQPTSFQQLQARTNLTVKDLGSPKLLSWAQQLLLRLGLDKAQAANTFFGAPSVGAGPPDYRLLTTADMPGISAVITTAKLTAGGANGSMTFVNGILTAQTPAT